jgi:hypothetical protein
MPNRFVVVGDDIGPHTPSVERRINPFRPTAKPTRAPLIHTPRSSLLPPPGAICQPILPHRLNAGEQPGEHTSGPTS